MGKYKYFIKNLSLLTVSSFGTKILIFFLIPLYTNVLSTADYGTYDLYSTTITVLIPILTLNISESVLRFSIDVDSDRIGVFSVSIRYFSYSVILIIGFCVVNHFLNLIPILKKYEFWFVLLFISQSILGIVSGFARGLDLVKDIAIGSIIGTSLNILLNIVFLLSFKLGLRGYFAANVFSVLVQDMYLLIRVRFLNYIKCNNQYKRLRKDMVAYSTPLIANSVAWWVNSVSDRYIVVLFLGIDANGVYSIASKIPAILSLFQSLFNQAWTLSAVKDFDANDESGFFSNMYSIYNCIMVLGCSLIIILNKFIAKLLYAKEFYAAWEYVPFLTIAVVFAALAGYFGGIFAAKKQSKIYAKSTVLGAIANILMNIIMVPIIGALGAAISTTISYLIVYLIRLFHFKHLINLDINYHTHWFSYFVLTLQAVTSLIIRNNAIMLYLIQTIFFAVLFLVYFNNLKSYCFAIINKLKK